MRGKRRAGTCVGTLWPDPALGTSAFKLQGLGILRVSCIRTYRARNGKVRIGVGVLITVVWPPGGRLLAAVGARRPTVSDLELVVRRIAETLGDVR